MRLYVKMDGIRSEVALLVDGTMFGSHLTGVCGNCNGVDDDYDGLSNGYSLDLPITIASPKSTFTFIPDN